MNAEPCPDRTLLIQADHDGELSAAESAQLQMHLRDCAGCRAQAAFLRDLSTRLHAEVPLPPLPPWLQGDRAAPFPRRLREATRLPAWHRRLTGLPAGLSFVFALALVSIISIRSLTGPPGTLPDEAVAAHIRALQPGHLMDVVSTDRHTVKPWFAGKLDFSPPVRDFADVGFPLKGGRLDYLNGRPVAALVYAHGQHMIDVLVWPGRTGRRSGTDNGYNFISRQQGDMVLWFVSDLNSAELRGFADRWGP